MTPDVSVRRADSSDARLLASLGARTFSETFASENTPEDMAAYLQSAFSHAQLTAELSDAHSIFFVAEATGEAAGYAKLYEGDLRPDCLTGVRAVELVRLYVLQRWLGRGVGRALMQRCMDEARRAGYSTMWLGVWERNRRAQAFYRKCGFRPVGERIFQLGSDAQTDWLMERAL
jgi:ribosomal protein S18 acetylase RimI-like enzyme